MSYECHITSHIEHAQALEALAQEFGWKTSEIKRDPVLGDKSYFYLTRHSAEYISLFSELEHMVNAMRKAGIPVVREKIEHIVYDTKTGIAPIAEA